MKQTKSKNNNIKEPKLHINGIPSFKNLGKQELHSFIVTLEFQTKTYFKNENLKKEILSKVPP